MEWTTEERGKPPNPRTRRLETRMGYPLMLIGGSVIGWQLGHHAISPVVVTLGGMLYAGGCWLAWRGSYYRQPYNPVIELDLARTVSGRRAGQIAPVRLGIRPAD